jgi:aminoglycoside phosphotransferase (APT) family kinase protein
MQLPASPDELTADWLTSVLNAQGLGLNYVQSCDVELLGGEQGMTGQLARLRVRSKDDRPGLPATLIAKFSAAEPAARALISALGHYEREVRFSEELSSHTPVPTPHCYYSHLDSETGFALLVLEDLARARNGNSIAGCSVDEVARVLSTLAKLHATWWQAVDLAHAEWLRLRFLLAPEAMVGAFSDAWPSFLQKLSIPLTSQISEMGNWIGQNLPAAARTLFESGPRTLIHNDVQADNLFFGQAGGEVIFIDWQMATYARCVIDVAGWVRGQLEPEVRRTAEPQLLRLYHDALVANGVQDYPFEQCMADYRLATVLAPARLACAVGLSEGLHAPPGAFWDTLFPRYPD